MGASAAIFMATSAATGAYTQANAAAAQGSYQKHMADINSNFANIQADDAIKRGDREASIQNLKTRQLVGSQRASLAAQGIDVNSGSALQVQDDTKMMGELDALTIKNNAWRTAWGYKAQGINYEAQGEFADLAGQNEYRNTLLTGGLRASGYGADAYEKYKNSKS